MNKGAIDIAWWEVRGPKTKTVAEEEKAQVRFDRYFGGQPHKMLRKSRSV